LSTTHKSLAVEDPIAPFYSPPGLLVAFTAAVPSRAAAYTPLLHTHVVAQEHNSYFLLGNIYGGGERLQHQYWLNSERQFTSEINGCPIII